METSFVINSPTCSRSGQSVANCSCGGHGHSSGNGSDAKPTPIPIIDINFADEAESTPEGEESEPGGYGDDYTFGYEEQQVLNTQQLDAWVPEDADDVETVNAKDRPTPMPVVDLDYDEMAKQQ